MTYCFESLYHPGQEVYYVAWKHEGRQACPCCAGRKTITGANGEEWSCPGCKETGAVPREVPVVRCGMIALVRHNGIDISYELVESKEIWEEDRLYLTYEEAQAGLVSELHNLLDAYDLAALDRELPDWRMGGAHTVSAEGEQLCRDASGDCTCSADPETGEVRSSPDFEEDA